MTATQTLAPFETKAANYKERTFEGLASTYDVDLGNDRILPGAFTETLAKWRRSGLSLPLIDQHDYSSVTRNRLGKLLDARETDRGLWTKWKVFETAAGNDLMAILREEGLDGLSIGYQVKAADSEYKDGIRHIRALNLLEVSAVNWGMNPSALIDTHSVKQRGLGAYSTQRIALEDQFRRMEGREAAKRQRIAMEAEYRDLQLRSVFGAA